MDGLALFERVHRTHFDAIGTLAQHVVSTVVGPPMDKDDVLYNVPAFRLHALRMTRFGRHGSLIRVLHGKPPESMTAGAAMRKKTLLLDGAMGRTLLLMFAIHVVSACAESKVPRMEPLATECSPSEFSSACRDAGTDTVVLVNGNADTGVDSGPDETPTESPSNECTNPGDLLLVGTTGLVTAAAACAGECLGTIDLDGGIDLDAGVTGLIPTTCIGDCVDQETAASGGCAVCYGELLTCGLDRCSGECIPDPQSTACLACVGLNCSAPFLGCAGVGLTLPMLPGT